MNRRINKLSESPCYQCGCSIECEMKTLRNPALDEIKFSVFANADFDYHDCGIWIALNAPEMVEVDEW